MYRRFIYAKMAYAITRHFDYASSAAPVHADTADMFYQKIFRSSASSPRRFECYSSASLAEQRDLRDDADVLPCHLSGRLRRRQAGTSIRTLANEPEQPPLLRCLGCLLRAESPAPHGLRPERCAATATSGILPPRTPALQVREMYGPSPRPSSLHRRYRDPTVAPGG